MPEVREGGVFSYRNRAYYRHSPNKLQSNSIDCLSMKQGESWKKKASLPVSQLTEAFRTAEIEGCCGVAVTNFDGSTKPYLYKTKTRLL